MCPFFLEKIVLFCYTAVVLLCSFETNQNSRLDGMESLLFCTLSNKRLTQMERLDQVFVLVSAGAGEISALHQQVAAAGGDHPGAVPARMKPPQTPNSRESLALRPDAPSFF